MKLVAFYLLLSFSVSALADSGMEVENCILSGLKGVSSDVAARMVRQACESKLRTSQQHALLIKHGEPSDDKLTFKHMAYKDGGVLLTMKNISSKTALIVNIEVAKTGSDGTCPQYWESAYVYQTKVKSGAEAEFWAPALNLVNKDHLICAQGVAVRNRATAWTDIDLGVLRPMSSTDLNLINQELGTSYGSVYRQYNSNQDISCVGLSFIEGCSNPTTDKSNKKKK